ncbi:hypothetical protein BC828DRAFT_19059 [Blastocladiella britannica]|nr:hypothetical protein BC828DRAFT_19059 [Blastocladiella britannica]
MLVGMSLGAPAGGAVNPAADLGGRIAMAMVGYGGKVFSAYDAYFWIPIVIGPVGAVIGTGIQRACLQVDEIRLERIDQK